MTAMPHTERTLIHPTAIAMALATAFAQAALAQPAPAAGTPPQNAADTLERVVVVGQVASLRKAVATEHAANNIVSAVSADDVGGLPDKNAAEALARMPGLSVQRDQGEGRYVVVRGLAPEFNTVTINGALTPSPEQGTRAVSLDVIPAGLIRLIEVQKTATPDRDANSLGGTVDIRTLTAFDLPARLKTVNLGASYNQNTKSISPNGGLLWANRYLDGTLGVAVGISGEDRKFGSDDVETGGKFSGGRLSGWSMRDYHPHRERDALGASFDFRPRQGETYYLHTLVSRFSDNETRDQLVIGNFTGTAVAEGQTATARLERRLRDRKYYREIDSAELGTDQTWGNWKAAFVAGLGRATEDTPDQLNEAVFRYAAAPNIGFISTTTPTLIAPASVYNPANFSLNAIGFQKRASRDNERHVKADFGYGLDLGAITTDFKFGVKVSRRAKTNDTDQWTVSTSGLPATLASYTSGPTQFPWGDIGLGIDPEKVKIAVAGKAKIVNVSASAVSDWRMEEDGRAGYLMATATGTSWNLVAGLRNERTEFKANGAQYNVNGSVSPVFATSSNSHTLPNLQGRLDLSSATSLRAAITRSLIRPNFSQLAPGVTLSSSTEATVGNPNLLPLRSTNIDLGVQHLLGRDGTVSAYLFAKDIKDFTYATNIAGTGQWVGYTTVASYANGSKGRIGGLELNWSQALKTLPSPWDGLIVGANGTFSTSRAEVSPTVQRAQIREIDLPGHSRRVGNLMVGYEKGAVSTRLAMNYKSSYLLSLGGNVLDPTVDQVVDSQKQLDFSFKWQASRDVQWIFEAINLNNEVYYTYQGTKPYNVQYERYGRTYRLGVSLTL